MAAPAIKAAMAGGKSWVLRREHRRAPRHRIASHRIAMLASDRRPLHLNPANLHRQSVTAASPARERDSGQQSHLQSHSHSHSHSHLKGRAKPSSRRSSDSRRSRRSSANQTPAQPRIEPSLSLPISKKAQISKNLVTIDSNSLISLCSPFTIPDQTADIKYVIEEDRFKSDREITLSGIYGSLETKNQNNTPKTSISIDKSFQALNKQKHLAYLLNTFDTLDKHRNSTTEDSNDLEFLEMIDPSTEDDDDNEEDNSDLDSFYESSLDLNKGRIPETFIPSFNDRSGSILAPIPEKPYLNVLSVLNDEAYNSNATSSSGNRTASFFFG